MQVSPFEQPILSFAKYFPQQSSTIWASDTVPNALRRKGFYLYRISGQISGRNIDSLGVLARFDLTPANIANVSPHEGLDIRWANDLAKALRKDRRQTHPVLLAHQHDVGLVNLFHHLIRRQLPVFSSQLNGLNYQLWHIDDVKHMQKIQDTYDKLESAWLADGHHRFAAFQMLMNEQQSPGHMMVWLVDEQSLQIDRFYRVIKRLPAGQSIGRLLDVLQQTGRLKAVDSPVLTAMVNEGLIFTPSNTYQVNLSQQVSTCPSDDYLQLHQLLRITYGWSYENESDYIAYVPDKQPFSSLLESLAAGKAIAIIVLPSLTLDQIHQSLLNAPLPSVTNLSCVYPKPILPAFAYCW